MLVEEGEAAATAMDEAILRERGGEREASSPKEKEMGGS